MRKVRLSEFRSFVRGVLAEAEMKRSPELTGRTAYDPNTKKMYVEWDDGDQKVVAVYNVESVDEEETPWFDYNGDEEPDRNPKKLTYEKSEEGFPGGLQIVTADIAIKAAQAYKRSNPDANIASVNMLDRAANNPRLVNLAANEKLQKAAGGINKARPDFYTRKAEQKAAKKGAKSASTPSPAAPAAATASRGGSSSGASSSRIGTDLRVEKGDYGFTFKFNNTSRGTITIFVYLLDTSKASALGMSEGEFIQGKRQLPAKDDYLGQMSVSPGESLNYRNLFDQEDFKDAKTNKPGKTHLLLAYYRGKPGKDGVIDQSKIAGTSLSRLFIEKEAKE